jgi:hypothetical protein
MSTGMIVDGVFASQAIDSSGEILDIDGCDISTLAKDGVANYEHKEGDKKISEGGNNGEEIVGRIIYAKKIFSVSDCDTDREEKYWDAVKVPFIYGMVRLYDGAGHSGAQALAAQIRDHHANEEPTLVRYSIEGSTLERDKAQPNRLLCSVARRVAMTLKPCNRTCASGLISDPRAPEGFDKQPETDRHVTRLIGGNVEKSERLEHPLYTRLGGVHELESNPLIDEDTQARLKAVAKDAMLKALEAGSYNVAPSSLVQGAALQREDRGLKARAMAAVRDYGKKRFDKAEFRSFAKTYLPEADDNFLDHFTDVAEDYHMKRGALKKKEGDEPAKSKKTIAPKKAVKPKKVKAPEPESFEEPDNLLSDDAPAAGADDFDFSSMPAAKIKKPKKLKPEDIAPAQGDDLKAALEEATNMSGGKFVGLSPIQRHGVELKGKALASYLGIPEPKPQQLTVRGKAAMPPQASSHIDVTTCKHSIYEGHGKGCKTVSYTADEPHYNFDTGYLNVPARPGTFNMKTGQWNAGHTGGYFKHYIPGHYDPAMHGPDPIEGQKQADKEKADFNQLLEDGERSKYHDNAMSNWVLTHKLMRQGKTPDEVVAYKTAFSMLSPNCLDAETEALTQRGWIKGFDLTMDDVLLTKNAKTGQLEWQKPLDLRMFPDYEGPMVEFKSRSFYALTTPDHEWLVTTGRGHLRIKKSVDITFDNDKIHRTGEYLGAEKSGLTVDEAEVLGWFVTDGHYSVAKSCDGTRAGTGSKYETPGVYARLNQSTTGNPEKCARIDLLMERVAADESSKHVGADGKAVWTVGPTLTKMLLERAPERRLSVESLLDLDAAALDRLRETMILGDGHSWNGGEGWSDKECLVTGRKDQAEAFQALLTMTGNASSIVWRDMSEYEPRSEKMNNIPKMKGCFVVTSLQRQYVRVSKEQRTDIPNMKVGVWCPILANMFFVARRSGNVFITKNTPVPVHEMMFSYLADSMKHTGIDLRDPRFAGARGHLLSEDLKEGRATGKRPDVNDPQKYGIYGDWKSRDTGNPNKLPEHAPEHSQRTLHNITTKNAVKPDPAKGIVGRKAGQLMSFMLAQNKFVNMAKYHKYHDALVNVFRKHGPSDLGDQTIVNELMHHKEAAGKFESAKARAVKAGKKDFEYGGQTHSTKAEYPHGVVVGGLAPKTSRLTVTMAGGGSMHVPDTHMNRFNFGMEKGHGGDEDDEDVTEAEPTEEGVTRGPMDNKSIASIKKVLWEERNHNILNQMDRYYEKHSPAVDHMVDRWGHWLEGETPQEKRRHAVFGGFWKNWSAIVDHEKSRGMWSNGRNDYSDHRPSWAATLPHTLDKFPVTPFLVMPKLKKGEEGYDESLPLRAAMLHHAWIAKYGEMGAAHLAMCHLIPQLLAAHAIRHVGEDMRKAEALSIDVKKALSEVHNVTPTEPGEQTVMFAGQPVVAGHAITTKGELALLHEDKDHFVAVPKENAQDWCHHHLMKLPKAQQGTHFTVTRRPAVHVSDLEN